MASLAVENTLNYKTQLTVYANVDSGYVDSGKMRIQFRLESQNEASDILINFADRTMDNINIPRDMVYIQHEDDDWVDEDEKVVVVLEEILFDTYGFGEREYDYISLGFVYDLTFQDDDSTKQSSLQHIMPKVLQDIRENFRPILKDLLWENMRNLENGLGYSSASDVFHRLEVQLARYFRECIAVKPIFQLALNPNLRNWPLIYKYALRSFELEIPNQEANFKVGDRVIYDSEAYTIIARVRERWYRIENPRSTVEVGEGQLRRVNPNFPDHKFDYGEKVIYEGEMYAVRQRLTGLTDWYYEIENAMRTEMVQESDLQRVMLIRTIDAKSQVRSVAVNRGRIVSGLKRKVKIWNTDGTLLKTLEGHDDYVRAVAFLGPDRIVSGSEDDTVKIWNTDGTLVKTLRGHSSYVTSVAILGSLIVSGSLDKTVKIWNTDGTLVKTLRGHSDGVWSVAILGDLIVSGSDDKDKTVKIWNTDGTLVKTLRGHRRGVLSVAILGPDRIVSGSFDKTVKIWNTNGECLKTLEGHSNGVWSVAILGPDRIVSGSDDKTVKIWNTDGECLKTLEGHRDRVWSVAILGPDRIVSGSWDKTIKIWDVSDVVQVADDESKEDDVVRVADDESKGEEQNNNKKKYTIGIQNAMILNRMIDADGIQMLLDFEGTWSFNDSDPNNIGLSLKPVGAFAFEDFVLDLAVQIVNEIANLYDRFLIIDKAREEYRKRVVDRRVDIKRMPIVVNAVYTVDETRRLATIKLVDYFEEEDGASIDILTPEEFRERKEKYGNEYGDNVLNEVDREKRDIEEHLKRLDSELKPITKEKIRLNKEHKAKVAAEKKLIARKERLKAWQKKITKLTLEEYQDLLRQTYLTQMENCTNDIDMINKRPWLAEDFKSTVFFRFPYIDKDGKEKFKTFCLTDSSVSKQKKKEEIKANPMAKVIQKMLENNRKKLTNPDLNEEERQQILRRIDQLTQQVNSLGSAYGYNLEAAEGMALDQAVSKDHWIDNMLYANWVEQDGSPYDVDKKVLNRTEEPPVLETREGRGGKPGSDQYVRITSIMGGGDVYLLFNNDLKKIIKIKRGDGRRRDQSEIGFVLPQGWTYPVAVYLKFEKRVAIGNIRGDVAIISATHGNRYANIYKVTQIANFNHYDDINVVNECEGDCATTTVSKKRKNRLKF